MMKRRKKPSRTRRHRESIAAKRKARAFYRMRNGCGAGVLPPDGAGATRSWRGCGGVVLLAMLLGGMATAVVRWIAAMVFFFVNMN